MPSLYQGRVLRGARAGGVGSPPLCRAPEPRQPEGVMRDDPIVFHDLRHTFGTQCAARGIDLPKIQAWMGHADIQTTMRYLHYVPPHDDTARLTAAFTANVGTEAGTELATGTRN